MRLVVCFMPMSRASRLAPATQYATGNCDMTGMRCCARFMRTCGMSDMAALLTSIDWTISRWTSSGISGPEPGVARVAMLLYGMRVALYGTGPTDYSN